MTDNATLKHQPRLETLLIVLIFLLSGCTQLPLNKNTNDAPTQVVQKKVSSVLDYIEPESTSDSESPSGVAFDKAALIDIVQQAKKSRSPRREALLIKATHTALSQESAQANQQQWPEQVKLATKIYALIDTSQLNQSDLDYYYELIGLELAVAQRNQKYAQQKLTALDAISSSRKIPLATKHYLTDSRIRASALSMQGDNIAAARFLVFRTEGSIFPETDRQLMHDRAWHYLSLHRQESSNQTKRKKRGITSAQAPSEEWQAWLELNDIFELSDQSQLGLMHGKIKSWSRDWNETQIGRLPPFEVTDFMLADFKAAQHVAIFLPTSGQLQHAGKAIIDGLMASYYREQNQTSAQLKVTIYDTAQAESIADLYMRAKDHGAEFIIGPLQKENVEALKQYIANIPTPEDRLPVLALNYTGDNVSTSRHFFEFGLSAEDEAMAVADHALAQGLDRVLILRPDSAWGERVSTAFKQQFNALNGQVLDETAFSEPRQFSKEVQHLLGLQISRSRHKEMERELGQKLEYTPRRRQDVDFIFLLATPNEARQLKPTINYHYGQKIPVFATSHVYAGKSNPTFDKDLNNIQFVDIPWVLSQDIALKKTFEQHIPNAQTQFQRLHALGIDAFSLMREFPILKHVSSSELNGATGILTIQADGRVNRQLSWAKFKRGNVKVIEDESH